MQEAGFSDRKISREIIISLRFAVDFENGMHTRVVGESPERRYCCALVESDDINSVEETEGRRTEEEGTQKAENNYE